MGWIASSTVNTIIANPGTAFSSGNANTPIGFPVPGNNAVQLTGNYASAGATGGGANLLFGGTVTNGQVRIVSCNGR